MSVGVHQDIVIRFVPKDKMRYDTLGDYFEEDGRMIFEIDDSLSPDEAYLVALHELIEWKLCQKRGISNEVIDAFDLAYTGDGEPGDEPAAPYRREHRYAMLVELGMAHEMGIRYGEAF